MGNVPDGLGQVSLTFQETVKELLLFRCDNGNQARSYDAIYKWHRKLGEAANIAEALPPYVIRREVADSLEEAGVAVPQISLALAHRSQQEFSTYQSSKLKIDLQSLIIGEPSQGQLIRACHQMKRFVDPEFPWALNAREKDEVKLSSVEYQSLNQDALLKRQNAIQKHGSLRKAKKTPEEQLWLKAKQEATAKLSQLFHNALLEKQTLHRQTAPVARIDQMLNGLLPAIASPINTKSASLQNSLRRHIAQLMFPDAKSYPVPGSAEDLRARGNLVAVLVEMVKAPTPHFNKKIRDRHRNSGCESKANAVCSPQLTITREADVGDMDWEQLNLANEVSPQSTPLSSNDGLGESSPTQGPCENLSSCSTAIVSQLSPPTDWIEKDPWLSGLSPARPSGDVTKCTVLNSQSCLYCHFREIAPNTMLSVFATGETMRRHAERKHFRRVDARCPRDCPDPYCVPLTFRNESHFKNHAAKVHNVRFARVRACRQ